MGEVSSAPSGWVDRVIRRLGGARAADALECGTTSLAWQGLPLVFQLRGTSTGAMALVLASRVGAFQSVCARVPVAKLLEHLCGTATVRAVVVEDSLWLESVLPLDEVDPSRAESIVRARLGELFAVASAW